MSSALPCPPFVDVSGVPNLRDIGYVGNGELVRTGLVYRSADPSKATPEELEILRHKLGAFPLETCATLSSGWAELIVSGIQTVFDLRSTPEIKRDGPEWAGVEIDSVYSFQAHGITRSWQ